MMCTVAPYVFVCVCVCVWVCAYIRILNVSEGPWGSQFLGVRRPKAGPLIQPDTVANHNLSLGSLCNSDQA